MAQMEINFTSENGAYGVVLTGKNIEFFEKAAHDPALREKEGEALVAALLARSKGEISEVNRYRDGKFNDGANGEAACQKFNDKGTLIEAIRCRDGKANDGANGEAAYQGFNDDGTLIKAMRFRDNRLNDGANGGAAYQEFNDKGTLIKAMRFRDNKRNDGANGEVACQMFDDAGTLIAASHFSDGNCVRDLSEAEIQDYIADQQRQKDKATIESSFGEKFKVLAL